MTLYPLCGIIPPHILKAIHLHGDLQEKAFANHTLLLSEKIRTGRREILTPAQPVTIQKQRAIYDTKNSEILPGKLVRKELSPSVKDITVNESYDASGATYDLFKDIYLRNSIDGKGLTIVSTVHYSHKYDNAFWNGEQMVYGDGDGDLFGRFTKCIDITGHELTHGVVQYEANFAYQNQSGALHESYADIFGSLVKQRSLKQTADKADWLTAEYILIRVSRIMHFIWQQLKSEDSLMKRQELSGMKHSLVLLIIQLHLQIVPKLHGKWPENCMV
jgi:Zn-dependent metalloprotease